MINRLPPEELLKAVRSSQAEWRAGLQQHADQVPARDGHPSPERVPVLRDSPRRLREPRRSSLAGI
ncbi:MAG TPA: hypothetical protein VFU47_00035 [Armatimonadota bacterium]|nr:hypothetical protein [Armatimonadota bacterium]